MGFVLLFASCNGCSKDKGAAQGPNAPTAFEQQLTNADSLAVKGLIDQFFGYVKAEKYHEAAAMLYHRQVGVDKLPVELDNAQIEKTVAFLQTLPFDSYEITYMKFRESGQNEVMCDVILQRGQNGAPDAKTKYFFTPVKISDSWHLILTDHPSGERPVTDFNQRDSLEDLYKKSSVANDNQPAATKQ